MKKKYKKISQKTVGKIDGFSLERTVWEETPENEDIKTIFNPIVIIGKRKKKTSKKKPAKRKTNPIPH